ncbi:hypothetical protein BH18ACT5_BH18ACT5_18960 [soil metagenome]
MIEATGLANGASPQALLADYQAEQERVRELLGETPLADLPSLAAWRRVFSRFGAKPTQCRSAAEALLRRLTKQGDIPSINALVDLGNFVSIRYALPVAVIDLGGIAGSITVRFADGAETFTDLGSAEAVHPEPGEVVFVDDDSVACARRWCWRQSQESATTLATTEALFVVEGHHSTAAGDVTAAVADLAGLLATDQPQASFNSYFLNIAS